MYQVVEKPMDAEMRSRLLGWMREAPSPFRGAELALIAHSVAFAISCVFFVEICRDLKWNRDARVFAVILAVALVIYAEKIRRLVVQPLRERKRQREKMALFRNAVTNATTARVERIESNHVVSITHDEGTIYLFAIDANRCFWFELARPCDNWPNSKFEIARVAGVAEEIGPFCYGKKIRPRAHLDFEEFADFDFDKFPEDGVIEQSIDDFLKSARAQPQ
jgi:hypothetical protein